MRVIPVIDVKAGVVVHAQGGDRGRYRPIASALASGTSDPAGIVAGYLSVFPFDTIYVADLDGIAGCGRNHDTICALQQEFPRTEFWVDEGGATAATLGALARMPNVRPVVGSETLDSIEAMAAIRGTPGLDPILSLDFRGNAFLGPRELLAAPSMWPATAIAMTLTSVGAEAGPDLGRVRSLCAAAPACSILAAGGVRHRADLLALAEREHAKIAAGRGHRSSLATLRRFTESNVELALVAGPSPPRVADARERVTAMIRDRWGGDRGAALAACRREFPARAGLKRLPTGDAARVLDEIAPWAIAERVEDPAALAVLVRMLREKPRVRRRAQKSGTSPLRSAARPERAPEWQKYISERAWRA